MQHIGPELQQSTVEVRHGAQGLDFLRNRLQSVINLVYLLGADRLLSSENRVYVTHLQSELAMVQCLLRHRCHDVDCISEGHAGRRLNLGSVGAPQ